MDQIQFLIDQAHDLFDDISVFEVIDLPTRQEAINRIVEFYGAVDVGKVDRYISIIDRLRQEIENSSSS